MRNRYEYTKDDHSITLYRKQKITDQKSKNYGQDTLALIGHYSSLDALLNKLVFLELLDKGTVDELYADLKVVVPTVKELLK